MPINASRRFRAQSCEAGECIPARTSKDTNVNRTAPRIFLAAAAIVASVATAGAQAPDPHHPGAPAAAAPMAMPPASGPVPGAGDQAGGPMGGEMGRMMETMRPSTAGGMGMPFEHVEGRIAYMKAELKVTDAQLVPWNAFADTMRADASAMKAMHEGMGKAAVPTATPDRMAARRRMMTARMAMMERSETSTKALYAALSVGQRTTFDQLMSGPMGMM